MKATRRRRDDLGRCLSPGDSVFVFADNDEKDDDDDV